MDLDAGTDDQFAARVKEIEKEMIVIVSILDSTRDRVSAISARICSRSTSPETHALIS